MSIPPEVYEYKPSAGGECSWVVGDRHCQHQVRYVCRTAPNVRFCTQHRTKFLTGKFMTDGRPIAPLTLRTRFG